MPELLKTTNAGKGRSSHYHIAYLNETTLSGYTSENNKHMHNILIDAETQSILIEPINDHTHEVTDYIASEKKDNRTEEEIVKEVIEAYKAAEELEKDSVELGEKCEEYYWGKQWDDAIKRELNAKKRAANTINEIAKNVDELSGHQRQARNNLVFLPTEEGDQSVADILNVVTKNILTTQNNFEKEEAAIFLDETIVGRGLINVYVDFEKNVRGDIVVERFPWKNVRFGSHNKDDATDCEYLVKYAWYSYDKLSQMFPEKIKEASPDAVDDDEDSKEHNQPTPALSYVNGKKITDPSLINYAKKEYKLLEMWKKVFDKTYVLVNLDDDFYFNAEGWSEKDINSVKAMGFNAIPVVKNKIRIIKVAGGVLLEDLNPADLEINDFYLIPVYGKKRKDKFKGIVADAIDPQDEINKRHSQSIDIANKVVSYGKYYDAQTFPTPQDKENFKQNASTAGFLQEVTDIGRIPISEEGTKFPVELVNLMELSSRKLDMIMNIRVDPIGANDSGVAIMQKTRVKLTGNEFLFDNLSFAKKKLGRLLIALIKKYYTPERIYRILGNEKARNPELQINGQPAQDLTKEAIMQLLETADLEKYDVDVSESTWTPTMRLANLLVLKELAQSGAQIPPETLIELMDGMPKDIKDKLINGINQTKQAAQQQEQAKMDMELGKTQIAAQAKQQGGAV